MLVKITQILSTKVFILVYLQKHITMPLHNTFYMGTVNIKIKFTHDTLSKSNYTKLKRH